MRSRRKNNLLKTVLMAPRQSGTFKGGEPMAVTIIHCADLHFDTAFAGLDDGGKAEIRREDLRQVFGRIVELAKTERADMLLIAGDLFDQAAASVQTVRYITGKLAEISDIPVYISAGNHDPLVPGSFYTMLDWGENVHVFGREMECIETPDFDLYGVSFGGAEQADSLLAGFSARHTDKPSLMLMHASLGGEGYNPITKQEAEASGLDYLALGHVHSYSGAVRCGGTVCAYPGCPEGRGFDELGEKGVIKAVIEKGRVSVEFVPVCKRQYHELELDVTGLDTYEAICGRILMQAKGSADDLYKIVLTGETEFPVHTGVIRDSLRYFMAKVVDKTTRRADYAGMAQEYNLRGLFVKKILEEQEASGDEMLKQALSYGLDALSGEKVDLL